MSSDRAGMRFTVAAVFLILHGYMGCGPDHWQTWLAGQLRAKGERIVSTGEGNGPVNALDKALREAIGAKYPQVSTIHLTDYKVRVLDTQKATGAVTRVLLDSTNGERDWSTIGVSENIIDASWQALFDSIVYGLLHSKG